jgi:hypothetical protein
VGYVAGEAKEPPLRPTFDRRIKLEFHGANFLRTLALPQEMEQWSLTMLREKVVKIGATIVRHGRYAVFQLAEVVVPRACSPRCSAESNACGRSSRCSWHENRER